MSSGADLVVLSWSRDTSAGRATVVREVLGASALPVLLLPVSASWAVGHGRDQWPYRRSCHSDHRGETARERPQKWKR